MKAASEENLMSSPDPKAMKDSLPPLVAQESSMLRGKSGLGASAPAEDLRAGQSNVEGPKPVQVELVDTKVLAGLESGLAGSKATPIANTDPEKAPRKASAGARDRAKASISAEEDTLEDDDNMIVSSSVYSSILMTVLFIAACALENPIEQLYDIGYGLEKAYLTQSFDEYMRVAQNIKTLEELTDFIQKIMIPISFNNDVSIKSSTANDEDNTAHFINGMNYMCGLQFTVKRTKLVANPDRYSKNAIIYSRKEEYGSANTEYDTEDKDPFGTSTIYTYTKKNSYNGKGGYVQFFPGKQTLSDANELMKEMVANDWFVVNKTIALTTELLFYNSNYGSIIYFVANFLVQSSGNIGYDIRFRTGTPQLYDSNQSTTSMGILFAIQIVFQLLMYLELLKIIISFIYHSIDLFTGKKIFIPTNDYMAVITIAFALTSRILWYRLVLGKRDTFAIPMTQDDFNDWIGYIDEVYPYGIINAITIILMCARNLVELTLKFPSFGILFSTLSRAKYDLLNFFILSFLLLAGFFFAAYFMFGYYTSTFSSVGSSIMAMFSKIVGKIDYESMYDANPSMAPVILFPFAIIFFFILINMFVAIVMSSYSVLRKGTQLKTEANARIAEEEGAAWTQKLMRLLCCVAPNAGSEEKREDPEGARMKNRENGEEEGKHKNASSLSLWNIFCLNLTSLCESRQNTHERIRQMQTEAMQKLRQEQQEERNADKKAVETEVIYMITQAIIYVAFIAIYSSTIFLQLNINSFFLSNDSMVLMFADKDGTYSRVEVGTLKDSSGYLDFVYRLLYDGRTNHALPTNAMAFSNPYVRATLIRNEFYNNTCTRTKDTYPIQPLDSLYKSRSLKEDYARPKNASIPTSTDAVYRYYPSGSHRTYRKAGGVAIYATYDAGTARRIFDDLITSLDITLDYLAIELVTYAPNLGVFVWTYTVLDYEPSGKAQVKVSNTAFRIKQYAGSMKYRGILEILTCLFVLYFVYYELFEWIMIWDQIRAKENGTAGPVDANQGTWDKIMICLYVDPKKEKETRGVAMLCVLVWGFFKLVYYMIRRFFAATICYLKKDFFNIVSMVSVCFALCLIFFWVEIILIDVTPTFSDELSPANDTYGDLTEIARLYSRYSILAAITTLCVFLKLIKFFSFSRSLYTLVTVVARAKVSLFFFVVMFMILLIGFAFAGYFLFGTGAESFHSFGKAFVTTFKMTVGGSNYGEMSSASSEVAPIFFIIYMLLFFVVLLNMFISIIGINYEETVEIIEQDQKKDEENGHSPPSTIDMVKNELQRAYDELKKTLPPDTQSKDVEAKMSLLYRIFSKAVWMQFSTTPESERKENAAKTEETKKIEDADQRRNKEEVKGSVGSERGEPLRQIFGSYSRSMLAGKRLDTMEELNKNEQTLAQIEKGQVSMWMSTLENALLKKSNGTLSIAHLIKGAYKCRTEIEFYPKESIGDLKPAVSQFVFERNMSYVQRRSWDSASLSQKYEYWCGMDVKYSVYYETEAARALEILGPPPEPLLCPTPDPQSQPTPAPNPEQKESKKPAEELLPPPEAPSPVTANPAAAHVAESLGAGKPVEEEKKAEDIIAAERETKKEEEEETPQHDKSLASADISVEMASSEPLVPTLGGVTLKSMFLSPAYNSKYSRMVSPLQWSYWNGLPLEQKVEFWVFHLSGKQRAKLWARMDFAKVRIHDWFLPLFPFTQPLNDTLEPTLDLVWNSMSRWVEAEMDIGAEKKKEKMEGKTQSKEENEKGKQGIAELFPTMGRPNIELVLKSQVLNRNNIFPKTLLLDLLHSKERKWLEGLRAKFVTELREYREKKEALAAAQMSGTQIREEEEKKDTKKVGQRTKPSSCLARCMAKKEEVQEHKNSDLPVEKLRETAIKSGVEFCKAFKSLWPDDDRMAFWLLQDYSDQVEIYFNEMSGNLLNSTGKLQDTEADIITTLLLLEHPHSKTDIDTGDKLDQLLESELNIRMYGRCLGLSQLQAKQHSLELMNKRFDDLGLNFIKQDAEFRELKNRYEKLRSLEETPREPKKE